MVEKETKRNEVVEFSLCPICGACPTVRFEGEKVIISDDLGGRVVLKLEEAIELAEKIGQISGKR